MFKRYMIYVNGQMMWDDDAWVNVKEFRAVKQGYVAQRVM